MTTQFPQNAAWPPPPAPRRGIPRGAVVLIATVLTMLLGLGILIALVVLPGTASASEVTREPVLTAGANPFMPPVGTDATGVTAPAGTGGSFRADTAGLYGGTRDNATCDAAKLVGFLDSHPQQASAWAGVLGIRTQEIADYVSGLTPVTLRADTLVTNHGYSGGRAAAFHSVLQSGTAVFVDRYGTPVVRCYCGNPLASPTLVYAPTYVGPTWVSFNQTNISVVQSSTVVINHYTLVDVHGGRPFSRPVSSRGDHDGDSSYSGGGSGQPGRPGDNGGGNNGGSGGNGDRGGTSGPARPDTPQTCPDGRTAQVLSTSRADLTRDGAEDTASLLQCGTEQDVQVTKADGTPLATVPAPPAPTGSTGTPEFDPSSFTLTPSSLRATMKVFGPQDTTTPTETQTWTWNWDGSSFTLDPSSVTPVESPASTLPEVTSSVPSTLPGSPSAGTSVPALPDAGTSTGSAPSSSAGVTGGA